MDDNWNGSNEPLLQDEEEIRYQEYLAWLASEIDEKEKRL